MRRKRLRVMETSVVAHRSPETLDAYADGSLPASQRALVDAHLRMCAECRQTVSEIQHLDVVLQDFPPAPYVAFPRFWSKLEARLPRHTERRFAFLGPPQLAAGFSLAVIASLVGVVALASDATLPDSPLYSVKHVRQAVQLSVTSGRERPRLELTLGKQRLDEAAVMLKRRRDDLAVASLRDLKTLLLDAAGAAKAAGDTPNTAEVTHTIAQIKTDLAAVRAANLEPDGSTAADIAAVGSAVEAAQGAINRVETGVDQAGPSE